MDPCHSVSPRSPAYTSAVTVAHLIRNIEQLKNKDKLISQLEKDLGQQWVAAQLAALERETCEGARSPNMSAPSQPLGVLPEDSVDPTLYFWTPTSTSKTGGVEDGRSTGVNEYTTGKQDLPKKLKDLKDRNKELIEKCRAYLHRTKELTAQNRVYKDSSDKMLHENKKMQELLEHSKLRVLQMTRQMNEQRQEKRCGPDQSEQIEELKKELMEDKKTIQALQQACSEKDRRIELIQHRKRRRRIVSPAEKKLGIRETIYGYDEDKSMDSDVSSISHSTVSDDDVWDNMISTEETERSYHRLMMEQLQLQRSHALLQKQTENNQDPQRELMVKIALQNDLFQAQCRIEKLEQLINEIGDGEVLMLLKERETILLNNKEAMDKACFWEKQSRQLQLELNKALEKSEDLEFQLMELENYEDGKKTSSVNQECQCTYTHVDHELAEFLLEKAQQIQEMEQLRKEISALVKGKEGDSLLKHFDRIREDEKKHVNSLESMARELQMKVISLQKEKDSLQDRLSQKGITKPGKVDNSSSAAREKQENLELKAEITKLINSENRLLEERIQLQDELSDWKTQYEYLKHQLDLLTQTQLQQQKTVLSSEHSANEDSSPSTSPLLSSLSRRPSKDRKSKPRSGDDPTQSKRRKSSQDDSSESNQVFISQSSVKVVENIPSKTDSLSVEDLKIQLRSLHVELHKMGEENMNLRDQLRQSALEKSSEAEADQQILLDKLEMLKSELELLRRENVALSQKLKQRVEEFHDSQDELNPRVAELEDYCEDLQERLHAAEMTERQMREKLKLVEGSIDEAESNEIAMREKYEQLLMWTTDAKKQIHELQRNGHELKEIVLDKDFVEQALREKIDFLQKCEAASVRRIEELEAIERDLREQLETKSDPKCQRELNKIQELRHQITFLETDNKALAARVSELEENEGILRENWRRVADEDYNRTQTLEEKVKMLESLNRDLKAKLADAQEYFVINVSTGQKSLAAELAQSQSSLRDAVLDSTSSGADDRAAGDDDVPIDQEKKLMEKLSKLKRQLSDVKEKKDSKIEQLQEKIVSLKETELKLSETISEMEMTERELRAKLALYESSEVTVEKMLKYQSKIEELRTSQESLLDQLESMENQEMTLQEKMQEMERTLRGKIVTLEVEMKNYKQKELKNAARIRELEKREKELSEKVVQQAEKENSLYVKISSLMDELKVAKEEVESLKTQLADKEDKVRKAKLLEVKLLEIEMEYAKKFSDVNSKLRRREEELRQKESSHEEEVNNLQNEVATLQSALNTKESEKNRRIAILEKLFAQKENDFLLKIASFEENIKELNNEKNEYLKQIEELRKEKSDLESKDDGYIQEMEILRQEVTSIKTSEQEYEDKISVLEANYKQEKQRADDAEHKVSLLEKEVAKEKKKVSDIEVKLIAMKGDIEKKMKTIETNFVEKESEYEKELDSLNEELALKEKIVKELESELEKKVCYVNKLEVECSKLRSKSVSDNEETNVKIVELEKKLSVNEKNFTHEISALKSDKGGQIEELKKKVTFLSTQLLQEASSREKLEKLIEDKKSEGEAQSVQLRDLIKEIEGNKQELVTKVKELESKNKEICELNLELSNVRYSNKSLQNDFQNLKEQLHESEKKFMKQMSEKDEKFKNMNGEIEKLQGELSQKCNIILKLSEKEKLLEEKHIELSKLAEEKAQRDLIVQEKIERSEHMLLTTQKEKENKAAELENLRKGLQKKEQDLSQSLTDIKEKEAEIQSLHSQIKLLEKKLVEVNSSVKETSVMADNYQKELLQAKKEQENSVQEIKQLKIKIEEKHIEVEQRSSEQFNTQSLISAKQQELEQARTELQKCLEEIKEYKQLRDQEKDQIQEQDQAFKKLSADFEQLSQQYEDKNVEQKHLKFKVANVELKLVEAENRYRELEARCASLELQLEERFAEAQQAEKVLRLKEEECMKLETKLEHMVKEIEQTSNQMHETEKIIIIKDKEFKLMKSKLETVGKEYDDLKVHIDQKNAENHRLKNELNTLQKEHEELKKEAGLLQKTCDNYQSDNQASHSEITDLKLQVTSLQKKWEDANNNLKASDDYLMQADNSFKSIEKKCKETEDKLKVKVKLVEDLEETLTNKHQEIESLTLKVKDVDMKCSELNDCLIKSEKDYADKCFQFAILESKFEKCQGDLKSWEEKCRQLNEKLTLSEMKLQESHLNIENLISNISILEDGLKEKESFCRDSQNDFDSLEHQHLELKIECENLKSKLNYFQQMLDHSQNTCKENETKLEHLESSLNQSQASLQSCQQNMSEKESNYNNLAIKLDQLEKELNSSEEKRTLFESKLKTLTVEIEKLKEEKNSYTSQIEQLNEEKKSSVIQIQNYKTELNETKLKCEHFYEELESFRSKSGTEESQLRQYRDKYHNLESECHKLQQEKESQFKSVRTLEESKHKMMLTIEKLEAENKDLNSKLKEVESHLNSKEDGLTELLETNQNLSGKLYRLEASAKEHEAAYKKIEQSQAKIIAEKENALSEVLKLRTDFKEISEKYEDVQLKFEDSHCRINELLENNANLLKSVQIAKEHEEIAKREQQSLNDKFQQCTSDVKQFETKCKALQELNDELHKTLAQMKNDLSVLKQEKVLHSSQLHVAEKEVQKVSEKLSESQAELKIVQDENEKLKAIMAESAKQNSNLSCVEDSEIIHESEIKVSLVSSLQTVPHPNISKEQELAEKLHSLEIHHDEIVSQMEKLLKDVESYKSRDLSSQEKIKGLEKSLKEMREKVKKQCEKVNDLEEKEKQLLEQIADIETTVIIPLETENQELKDELNVVKQERDDAQTSGDVHKSLEDALLQRDELEKNITILAEEIKSLEEDKENINKQLTDFKIAEGEFVDKIEFLEDEVERLRDIEVKKSVIEEHLMDRVLDLEDREKVLQEFKKKIVKTLSTQVQGTMTDEELLQKLEYLKQKNEVLQDAESKYMDKILDLEEIINGLKSEVQMLKSFSLPSASKEIKLTSESVTLLKVGESETKTVSSKYTDTVDLLLPSEQTMTANELTQHLTHLEFQNSRLLGECEEKTSKIDYLETKIVLLKDSEAKLMEKLTEENINITGSSDIEELRKKVDHLTEENEFLAQSVESFKKLYKDEKEKCNELQDRVMEESSLYHELEETQSRLQSSESMVEEVQAEYEEQLSEREHQVNHLNQLLSASQLRENELLGEVNALKDYLDTLSDKKYNDPSLQSSKEELEQQIFELRTHHEHREQDLRKQIELLKLQEEESQGKHRQQVLKLEHYIEDLRHHEHELLKQVDSLQQHEKDLQISVGKQREREKHLQGQIDSLEKQVRLRDDESVHTDSGTFSDDQKKRSDPHQQTSSSEVFSTKVTLTLARPLHTKAPPPAAGHHVEGPTPLPQLAGPHNSVKSRQSPVDRTSQEDLAQLVEELQNRETSLKKRIQELESSDLFHKLEELEADNQNLQRKLRFAESKRTFEFLPSQDNRPRSSHGSGDKNNNSSTDHSERSTHISQRMLDKSEEVLLQRIKDLESVDKHNKTQLSELERDREILHEIARKDKATIHDLQVKIRELQLSERGLKEQINNLEVSEGSLYKKCETLEVTRQKLEDRVHELEIHDRRLRELVRRLKLNEEHWLSKSGGMENAVAELSANEVQLKRHLQDIEMEKGGLSERAEYLEARVRELENVELSLLQRLKSYEINEVTLKNRLGHLENSEAAAHSKAYELDVMNVDLSQRLQKTVEECAMLSQHVSQLQGQIQDLDRRLLSSKDSEIAYKQHVETLEKNENLVQKKVREFELREIDSQARIRELEQTNEILNDKMAALQRSENKLKFRIQQLEEMIGKDSEPLDQAQKQKVPQKLEDCQKYIVQLQQQIENLQQHLSYSISTTSKEVESVCMSVEEYSMLQKQSALLEETSNQLEEVEREKEHLSGVILQLRQGKGACGHEVEIEVLKRRLVSYKTLFNKLKFSLSLRQATSLLDSEQDSGPQGETLPAHQLLESERVLQSVRGSQDGKAEVRDTQQVGPTAQGVDTVQSTTELISQTTQLKPEQEESHWKAIEARKPKEMSGSWGGASDILVGGAKLAPPYHTDGSRRSSTPELEEVTVAFHLQSESELSSHHKTQNDTDSSDGPVPPPRRGRVHRVGKSNSNNYKNNSGHDSGGSATTDADTTAKSTSAANKKHYFGGEKSLPSSAKSKQIGKHTKPASLTSFGEDSLYLPSSTQEGVDSLDDGEAPPLPSSAPPVGGAESEEPMRQERRDSLDGSTSGMSIRDRIAVIEKQLQTEKTGSKADSDQVFYWKKKSTENLRQVEVLEKDNKYFKEDLPPAYRRKEKINRLEKELEEKRRYINLLEIWLSNLDDLLKNKAKQTDREMLEYLQRDLLNLRSELSHIGYRQEDAVLDAAALKTELEHRDKEIMSKRNEIEVLVQKLRLSQEECYNVEQMRRNALDSLRSLEKEVIDLQEAEVQLHNTQTELRTVKKQLDIKCLELSDSLAEKKEIELTLERIIAERDRLKCDLKSLEEIKDSLKITVDSLKKETNELNIRIEDITTTEKRNSNLAEHINKLNDLLAARTEKIQEVYAENMQLRERVHQTDTELVRLRHLCDDYNNLSARHDELDNFKKQAIILLQELQAKVERLSRKCQEKDNLLRRLGADLKRTAYRPSSALEDLAKLEHTMAHEEYNIDFPVTDRSPQRPARNKRSSSLDDLDHNYSSSDTDSASSMPVASSRGKRPTPYVTSRPRSAENFTSSSRARGLHSHIDSQSHHRDEGHQWSDTNQGQFVAIADYDPAVFSQSGRPGLELELREGDAVLITGPMDRTGYYEAEVNGRAGLVPANYLQPLFGSSHMMKYNADRRVSPIHHDHKSHSVVNINRQVIARPREVAAPSLKADSIQNGQVRSQAPDPPQNLHVKGIVSDRGLLLSWSPPKVDDRGNNKGFQLLGYMVYVNNQAYEQISNPKICEFVLEDLNLDGSLHLAVQSLYASGHISPKAELVFEGVVRAMKSKDSGVQVKGQQEDINTDLSSVLSSVHYKRGHRKAVMALYDYNPKQQSPHDYTAFELAFQAGDVIYVYGDPRPDGFFHGEVDGKRGLVPACFVEDISKIDKAGRKIAEDITKVI